jgi:Short C-terminal domain
LSRSCHTEARGRAGMGRLVDLERGRVEALARQLVPVLKERGTLTAETPAASLVDQLRQLGELRDSGVLTEEEFSAQKAKLLGS